MSGKITVQALAAAAGVSPSTVSRALRNHPRISQARREEIQALARAMNYRPDPLISALLTRRFRTKRNDIDTLAYITAYPERDGWAFGTLAQFYEGACDHAAKQGFRVEPFWLREPKMTGRRLSGILRARGIQGALIAPLPRGYGHVHLEWEHFSSAAMAYSMIRPSLHRAAPHHFHNMLLALRTMWKKGYRRIAVILSSVTNQKVGENFLAAALAFRHHHGERSIVIDLLPPLPKTLSVQEGLQFLCTRMKQRCEHWAKEGMPDCVFGPISLIHTREVLPRGVDLVFQSPPAGASTGVPYMDERPRLVGAAAVDLVIGQIQRHETGIPSVPKVVMVEGGWSEGFSETAVVSPKPPSGVSLGMR